MIFQKILLSHFEFNVALKVGSQYFCDFIILKPIQSILQLWCCFLPTDIHASENIPFLIYILWLVLLMWLSEFCWGGCWTDWEGMCQLCSKVLRTWANQSCEIKESVQHTSDSHLPLTQCKVYPSPDISCCTNHLNQIWSLWDKLIVLHGIKTQNIILSLFLPSSTGLLQLLAIYACATVSCTNYKDQFCGQKTLQSTYSHFYQFCRPSWPLTSI
jgi:hypothetical protein